MTTRIYYLIAALIVLATLIATVMIYPQLPNVVPTHWDINNHVNGYSPKWVLFVLGPGLMGGLVLLFCILPWLSPRQFEIDSFRSTYLQIMLIIIAALGYFHAVILWAVLGHAIDIGRAIVGGICLLFALLGSLMSKVRRNFYVGIRTPWALANERVWEATHLFAAKTFVGTGVTGLILTLAGVSGWPVIILLVAAGAAPMAYSLLFYKQLERRGGL
jgi:uncharacterized membrane protein